MHINFLEVGNILTVADDLLKNDGQKFLEMMEQLAERRMQREEEAAIDVEEDSEDEDEKTRSGLTTKRIVTLSPARPMLTVSRLTGFT